MRLPFFGSKTDKENRALLIDINSSEVTTLLVYAEDQSSIKITGVGNAPVEQDDVRNGSIVEFERVKDALETAIMQATEDQTVPVKQAIFGVYGELAMGTTTTARSNRGKNGPFNEQEIEAVDQVITENAQINIRNEHMETTGVSDIDLDIVTSSTVYTKVNGRFVPDVYTAEGESVEIAKYTAFTPVFHIQSMEKLAKKTGLKITAVAPEMFGLVKSLNGPNDYVVVNIGSDFTEVGVVFGKGIVANKWFPIGTQHFTKELAQKMGLSLKEADRVKKSYIYEKLASSENLLIQNCIENSLSTWLSGLELVFTEFKGVKTFASQIYLTGEGSELPDILEAVNNQPWTRSIPFRSPPEFTKVKLENLPNISDSTGNADYSKYIMPASLSTLFLEILNDQA